MSKKRRSQQPRPQMRPTVVLFLDNLPELTNKVMRRIRESEICLITYGGVDLRSPRRVANQDFFGRSLEEIPLVRQPEEQQEEMRAKETRDFFQAVAETGLARASEFVAHPGINYVVLLGAEEDDPPSVEAIIARIRKCGRWALRLERYPAAVPAGA